MDYTEAYDGYAAQGIQRMDAEIVKKSHFSMEPTYIIMQKVNTSYLSSIPAISLVQKLVGPCARRDHGYRRFNSFGITGGMTSEERPISAMVNIFIGFFRRSRIACPRVHIIVIFIP